MAEKEEWRDVVGYGERVEQLYEISNRGRLRNKNTKHIHKPEHKPNGYIEYHLSIDGKDRKVRAHKLVMLAFAGDCPGKEINHINHDKADNRIENLEWVTHAENIHEAMKRNLGAYRSPYKVMCLETGEIFFSAGDAAEQMFGDRSKYNYINKQIYGERKSYKGYHFERVGDDMGKMSREKGKRGEREVANILKEHGYDAKRGVQYQGSPDSPDVVGLPGVHIEVKRVEAFNLYKALEQSKDDSGDGEMPVVVHRKNGKDWVAVLSLEDFLKLYEKRDEC